MKYAVTSRPLSKWDKVSILSKILFYFQTSARKDQSRDHPSESGRGAFFFFFASTVVISPNLNRGRQCDIKSTHKMAAEYVVAKITKNFAVRGDLNEIGCVNIRRMYIYAER